MKSRSKEIVFIDIETRPAPERVRSWLEPQAPYEPLPPLDPDKMVDMALADPDYTDWSRVAKFLGVRCGNLKDESKIMEKVLHALAESAQKEVDHLAKYEADAMRRLGVAFARAALCPRTAEIFMIQYALGDGPVFILCQDAEGNTEHRRYQDENTEVGGILYAGTGGEREVLERFFAGFLPSDPNVKSNSVLVNWTGSNDKSNFDWNMIQRRALALGLEVPWLQVPRVLRPKFLDLTPQFLEHDRWNSFCSLEKAAKELGIPTHETPVTGEHCWRYFLGEMLADQSKRTPVEPREQKRLALNYARQDISLLRDIYYRMYSV